MARNTYLTLKTPEEARHLWFEAIDRAVKPLDEERIPLKQALHRVLSRPAEALRSSPAFHGAAMDGVAVRAEDTFTASTRTPLRLTIGKDAHWINTGHPLPKDCNAVIMVEHLNTVDDGAAVITEKAAFPWQHVRKMGEDIVASEILLSSGTKIGATELGALAAGGVLFPTVWKRPRVAVIPTGSEIVPLDTASEEDLNAGRALPEFNSLIFSALIEEAGGIAETRPIVPDDPEALRRAVEAAITDGADIVLLNAGSSAGSHDFTAEVVRGLGELLVHGIAVMPGKPAVLGITSVQGRTVPVMGTPGYPVSAIVTLEEFLLPLLARWLHTTAKQRDTIRAFPCTPLPSRPGMEERLRVRLGIVDGRCCAVPLPRGAGTVTSLSRADGILCIPRDCEGINADDEVPVQLLRTRAQIEGALLAIGSHDNTLDLLDSLLRRSHPEFRLTSAHVGSLGGLMALQKGQCHLAGSHLLDDASGEYNKASIREILRGQPVILVRLADREQGLMTLPGNPKGLRGIEDLVRPDIRFINRQRGSGTRVLLDHQLRKLGILPTKINGYRDEEYTHMNVAVAVLSGRADTALGVRSAASALGLDFIRTGVEEYDLVIPQKYMQDERILALLDIIRSEAFKTQVLAMGGYGVERTGEVVWEYDGE